MQVTCSLDRLVGLRLEGQRDHEAKRIRGFEIDHQIIGSGVLNWQVAWLGTGEDLPDENSSSLVDCRYVRAVADQGAGLGKFLERAHDRESVADSKLPN